MPTIHYGVNSGTCHLDKLLGPNIFICDFFYLIKIGGEKKRIINKFETETDAAHTYSENVVQRRLHKKMGKPPQYVYNY